jgi:hypothetical protein
MKSIYILITLMSLALQISGQIVDDKHGPDCGNRDVTNAPLELIIVGSGQVFPFHDGQMLEVGRRYSMIAIPDRGYAFTNWQPVNVFNFTEITIDPQGNTNPPIISTVVSPVPEFTSDPRLSFTMQPVEVIFDVPGVRTITMSKGWQANFVPAIRGGGPRRR